MRFAQFVKTEATLLEASPTFFKFAKEMGYSSNILAGEIPESGAIFMSNIGTKKECIRRQLFGLPLAKSNFVLRVKKGMVLFLFEFESRQLHGVFRATCNGEINIEPDAFRSTGRDFPAQVRFTRMLNCSPLAEHEFQDAIRENYFSAKKFNFGLSKKQVRRLIMLFQSKQIPKKNPARKFLRCGENPAEGDERFDLRKKLVRDRLGLVTKEAGYDLGVCEYEGEGDKVKVDGHVYFKENIETGLHFRDDVNDDYDVHYNHGEIRGIKGKHDIQDGYRKIFMEPQGKHFGDIGLPCNDANLMMDGIANTNRDVMYDNRIHDEYHTIEGFKHSLSEHDLGNPRDRESRTIDDGRVFGHESVESELRPFNQHSLGKLEGTSDIRIYPTYDMDCSFRPTTSTEHPMFNPRGSRFAIKPDDEKFSFTSVGPSYNDDSVRGIRLPNDNSYSESMQNTSKFVGNFISEALEGIQHPSNLSDTGKVDDCRLPYSTSRETTMVNLSIPYDPELPDIPLGSSSSYFLDGESSGPVDDGFPSYLGSQEIPTSLSRRKPSPYQSQNLTSVRYFDYPGFALSSKHDHTISSHETRDKHIVEGNWAFKTNEFASQTAVEAAENVIKGHSSSDFTPTMSRFAAYDNAYGELRSKYKRKVCDDALKNLSPFDEEDPILPNKLFCRRPENKRLEGTDKRVSVFDRLTSASDDQQNNTNERNDLDASVNEVMKMLEKAVSSPPRNHGMKQDEDAKCSKIEFELPVEPDADLSDEAEEEEGGSTVRDTRLVDFKRRKKANTNLDDKCKGKFAAPVKLETGIKTSECLPGADGNLLLGMTCSRRKLVRPVFVRNESTNLTETAVKNDSNLTKPIERSETAGCEERVNEDEKYSEVKGKREAANSNYVFVQGSEENGAVCAPAASEGNDMMCGWIEW